MTATLLLTLPLLCLALGFIAGRRTKPKPRVWRTVTLDKTTRAGAAMSEAGVIAHKLGSAHHVWWDSTAGTRTLTIAWLSGTAAGDIVEDALAQHAAALEPGVMG